MTGRSITETEPLVMGWYEKHPELFDSEDNKALFKHFITRFLGLALNPVAEMRLESYSWSTIERTARLLVSKGQIKLSDASKEARHIEAEKTVKAVREAKQKVNYGQLYKLENGRYVPR